MARGLNAELQGLVQDGALRGAERVELRREGTEGLVEHAVADIDLELGPSRSEDPHAGTPGGSLRGVEQRSFPDAGGAA